MGRFARVGEFMPARRGRTILASRAVSALRPRTMSHPKNLAILVGGGPAPGINSVIGAATIRACLEGVEVLGVQDGFEWIMQGRIDRVRTLTIDAVSRIHFRGGSH